MRQRFMEEAPAAILLILGMIAIVLLVLQGYSWLLTIAAGIFLLKVSSESAGGDSRPSGLT